MTRPLPAVDVVVVSWNTRDELLDCLDGLLASEGVEVRCVVVDNASADGSADAVARRHPGVHLVRNDGNAGFARAVNQGLRAGEAPWVLLLNPDTRIPADALRTLVDRLERLPGHGLLAPRLVREDGSVEHSAHPLPSIGISLLLGTGAHRLLPRGRRARLLLGGAWDSDVERDVPWVVGAAVLARRAAVDAVGGLDERFFVYAEDVEWCDRMWRGGWAVRFTPAVTVVHLGNRSGAQRYGDERTAAYLRNTLAFTRRRHGAAWTAVYAGVNGAATVSRWLGSAALLRLRHDERRARRHSVWRAHARFYLGRSHPPHDPSP